jgi:hypothetical protein
MLLAWTRGLDCVAIDRVELIAYLGLKKRLTPKRFRWLEEDAKPLFPNVPYTSYARDSVHTAFFCRTFGEHSGRKLPECNGGSADDWANELERSKVEWARVELPAEETMVRHLAAAAHGFEVRPRPQRRAMAG